MTSTHPYMLTITSAIFSSWEALLQCRSWTKWQKWIWRGGARSRICSYSSVCRLELVSKCLHRLHKTLFYHHCNYHHEHRGLRRVSGPWVLYFTTIIHKTGAQDISRACHNFSILVNKSYLNVIKKTRQSKDMKDALHKDVHISERYVKRKER